MDWILGEMTRSLVRLLSGLEWEHILCVMVEKRSHISEL